MDTSYAYVKGAKLTAIVALIMLAVLFLAPELKKFHDLPETEVTPMFLNKVLGCSIGLRCSHTDESRVKGTGVLIHRYGHTYVLTAAHVIDCELAARTNLDQRAYMAIVQGTNEWKAYAIQWSDKHDLALLRLEGVGLVGKSAKLLDPKIEPLIGTKVLHAGNLFGRHINSFSAGVISRQYVVSELTPQIFLDQTTLVVYPGSSGGGVFDYSGRYIGMVSQMRAPNVNFIVPMRVINDWIDDYDLFWLLD
jgi:S1-C subfamily serine protease